MYQVNHKIIQFFLIKVSAVFPIVGEQADNVMQRIITTPLMQQSSKENKRNPTQKENNCSLMRNIINYEFINEKTECSRGGSSFLCKSTIHLRFVMMLDPRRENCFA
jgi:hypothetical protein